MKRREIKDGLYRCTKCAEFKNPDLFAYVHNNKLTGQCKQCKAISDKNWVQNNQERHSNRCKEWYKNNKEHVKQYSIDNIEAKRRSGRKYAKRNREKFRKDAYRDSKRFNHTKCSARERNVEFLLTYEEFIKISTQPCYYCNNELCGNKPTTGSHLDRIDNTKGYTTNNVISCGYICNSIRMDKLTVEETKNGICGILEGRNRRKKT
jgi:hypothetical protein